MYYYYGLIMRLFVLALFLFICCNFKPSNRERFHTGVLPAMALLFAMFGLGVFILYGIEIYTAFTSDSQYERDQLMYRMTSSYAWVFYLDYLTTAIMPMLLFIGPLRRNMYVMSSVVVLVNVYYLLLQLRWI